MIANPSSRTPRRRLLAAVAVRFAAALAVLAPTPGVGADRNGWSVVPHIGTSLLGDQDATVADAPGIVDGALGVAVDTGFVAGIGLRYDSDSRWGAELGWEYRSNDATTTAADGTVLPGGNYASNSFYVNGRYTLAAHRPWYTPWIGSGLIYTQEIDLDSEGDTLERSFSDAGAVGFQLLTGADVDLTERLYVSGELRYASRTGLELAGEGNAGRVTRLDDETVTLGLGLGLRF